MQSIFSFSVRQDDTSGLEVIKKIKALCKSEGKSFSFIIIHALKAYLEELDSE
jgi:predicted DNA-binding protein